MRVLVADDSVLLREGLLRLLDEAGHSVVAAVGDAPSLIVAAIEHRPDVAVVDIRMPPTMTDDGLRAAVEARAAVPTMGVLLLSAYVEKSYADALLSDGRGGVGYLLKDRVSSLDALVDALTTIRGGGTVLDPEVVAQLLVSRRTDPLDRLTPREREVLALMAEGRSNAAIAARLVVSPGAGGETHRQHLRQDRPARRRSGQPASACRAGLAEAPVRTSVPAASPGRPCYRTRVSQLPISSSRRRGGGRAQSRPSPCRPGS